MDFVVIGLGLGALALLSGLALLCLVAPRWQRRARAAAAPTDAAYPAAKAAERHAAGQALLVTGAVLLLTTLGGISANLNDRTGAFLIASVATVAAVGLLAWDFVYRREHPTPPRRRLAPRAAPGPEATAARAQRVRRAPTARAATAATGEAGAAGLDDAAAPAPGNSAAGERGDAGQSSDDSPGASGAPDTAGPLVAAAATGTAAAAAERAPEPATAAAPSRDLATEAPGSAAQTAQPEAEAPDDEPASQAPPAARIIDITTRNGRQVGPVLAPALPREPEPAPTPVLAAPAAADTGGVPAPDAGDDRVLALFPTASSRRERPSAPIDDDGKR